MTRPKGTRVSNGRSSIYQGSDGRWHGWVTMGVKDDGSPDRRHRTGQTEKEVTRKVRELERKRDAGNTEKPGRPLTVADWMSTYLTTIAPRNVDKSTLDSTYGPKIRNRIIPGIGRHRLDRLQPEHLDAFYAALEKEGLAPNTILQVHRILSRALKIAVRRGKVARNVAQLVDPPRGAEAEIEPLTAVEARRILTVCRDVRNGVRWSVALSMGLRQSEALGLRWAYLDLDAGTMRVFWQLRRRRYGHGCDDPHACGTDRHRSTCPPGCQRHARECPRRTGGGWHFVEPKGKGKATLVIPAPLVAQLREHRAAQLKERMRAGEAWTDLDLVFCTPTGRPIDPHDDWEQWRTVLGQAGVRQARVHDARHTAATLLLEQRVDVAVVQQILRHSQITTTRKYTHVTAKLGADAAERMSRALWDETATRTATTKGRRERSSR